MLSPDTVLQSRYRVVRLIAQGGMGAVYEAIDQKFGNTVALKETLLDDELLRKAFEREARLLNKLRHAALPVVTDYFFEGTGQFLVMQFIPGDDLAKLLEERRKNDEPRGDPKPFALQEVLRWADQLLDALEYLHEHSPPIVHRDIKPMNLKPTPRGDIVLLDFGLSKGLGVTRLGSGISIHGFTPQYAPPEQIQGTGTDPRSDLYALAATLYHLLTGVAGADAITRSSAIAVGQDDPLRAVSELNPEVPAPVADIIHRAMSLAVAKRPATAGEMRHVLIRARRNAEKSRAVSEAEKGNGGQINPAEAPTEVDLSESERLDLRIKDSLLQFDSSWSEPETWEVIWGGLKDVAAGAKIDERAVRRRAREMWDVLSVANARLRAHQDWQTMLLKEWVKSLPDGKWSIIQWDDFVETLEEPVELQALQAQRDAEVARLRGQLKKKRRLNLFSLTTTFLCLMAGLSCMAWASYHYISSGNLWNILGSALWLIFLVLGTLIVIVTYALNFTAERATDLIIDGFPLNGDPVRLYTVTAVAEFTKMIALVIVPALGVLNTFKYSEWFWSGWWLVFGCAVALWLVLFVLLVVLDNLALGGEVQ